MPLPLLIGAVAAVLLAVVGVTWFQWRVYARAAVGPVSTEVGVGGPGSGSGAGGGGGSSGVPWVPIALIGGGAALFILMRR